MKSYKVNELMVPLSEYATVSRKASLFDAVAALEKAQADFDSTRYRHRAILILNDEGNVVGKMSQLDVLKALEPKYNEMMDHSQFQQRYGFTKKFMQSILKQYQMWDSPLRDICEKAGKQNVEEYMHTPTEGEFVDGGATLNEAINQLVMGHHQSLLVTENKRIVGILRLTDVFAAIFHTMKECYGSPEPPPSKEAE